MKSSVTPSENCGRLMPKPVRQVPETIFASAGGQLILVGGRHWVRDLFSGAVPVAPGHTDTFRRNHAERTAWCIARGVGYAHWIFPDMVVVKRAELPFGEEIASLFETAYGGPVAGCHYPLDVMAADPAYTLRTDTHYSPTGCLRLADHVAAITAGLADPEHVVRVIATGNAEEGWAGDLGVQCDPPATETLVRLATPAGVATASNGVAAGNEGIFILLHNPAALSPTTEMIFGDSFFRALLVPLAHYFQQIVFCRSRFFHYEVVEAFAPDVVLAGTAERYLSSVTPDAARPHFFTYPLSQGRATKPDPGFAELWAAFVDRAALLPPPPHAPPQTDAVPPPPTDDAYTLEQTAFVLWWERTGRTLPERGDALSARWRDARAAHLDEAGRVIALLQGRGVTFRRAS